MIRLVTVIGHGVELLPHFIEHYERYVDEIQIVVYETDTTNSLGEEVKSIIEGYPIAKIVNVTKDRKFDWEKVTYLYNKIKNTHSDGWWVVADIDEFHLYPENSLNLLISDCDKNGWDIVRGGFIDRIGENGDFVDIVKDKTLWEQFPNAGFFRYPMSNACPNKICVMKGYVELTPGQHYANINEQTTWRWQGWSHPLINPHNTVQVHHFKWDKTSIERIMAVSEINQEYAFSKEYQVMFKAIRKSKYKIDLTNKAFMFELGLTKPEFSGYKKWNQLINKIKAI